MIYKRVVRPMKPEPFCARSHMALVSQNDLHPKPLTLCAVNPYLLYVPFIYYQISLTFLQIHALHGHQEAHALMRIIR